MIWTKKDLAQDMINVILPLDFRLFLKKNYKKHLTSMETLPILEKKCFVFINAGYFVIGKIVEEKGIDFDTNWRINSTEKHWLEYAKLANRPELKDKFEKGYDCWKSFRVSAALGWVYPEDIFSLIQNTKFPKKLSTINK